MFHQFVDIPPINDLYHPTQYIDALIIYFKKKLGGKLEMHTKRDHFLQAGSINKTAVVGITLLFILTAFTTISVADEPTSSKIETRNIVFSKPEL